MRRSPEQPRTWQCGHHQELRMFDTGRHEFLQNQFIPDDANGFLCVPFEPIVYDYMIRFCIISPGRYNIGFSHESTPATMAASTFLFPWLPQTADSNFLEIGSGSSDPYTSKIQIDTRTLDGWTDNTGAVQTALSLVIQRTAAFPAHSGIIAFYGRRIA